ncbi:sulfurtransferase complex subunit TusB [Marinobacter sp.]|uniref:sulfurtransferase complex subunit TusB n=1 Tax=Marinobacter sp. TaxID=50741 RepID=UPI00384AFEAF
MPTLHIMNKSPEHPRFGNCLAAIGEQDSLLLTGNGVLALACRQNARTLPTGTRVLLADAEARGLGQESLAERGILVDYAGFVELTAANTKIISW